MMNDPMYFVLVIATVVAIRFAWRKYKELQKPQDSWDNDPE